MSKYIDADLLRKEIDHRIDILEDMSIKCVKNDDTKMHAYYHGKAVSLQELLSFIDSLQQEQPEVDLEKDVESWFFNEISSKINVEHTMYHYFQECARRYYELGKNSK